MRSPAAIRRRTPDPRHDWRVVDWGSYPGWHRYLRRLLITPAFLSSSITGAIVFFLLQPSFEKIRFVGTSLVLTTNSINTPTIFFWPKKKSLWLRFLSSCITIFLKFKLGFPLNICERQHIRESDNYSIQIFNTFCEVISRISLLTK